MTAQVEAAQQRAVQGGESEVSRSSHDRPPQPSPFWMTNQARGLFRQQCHVSTPSIVLTKSTSEATLVWYLGV
jgi:hypothetical protein